MIRKKKALIANILIVLTLIIMFCAVVSSTLIKTDSVVIAASEKGEYFVNHSGTRYCICDEFETECSPCLKEPEQ